MDDGTPADVPDELTLAELVTELTSEITLEDDTGDADDRPKDEDSVLVDVGVTLEVTSDKDTDDNPTDVV